MGSPEVKRTNTNTTFKQRIQAECLKRIDKILLPADVVPEKHRRPNLLLRDSPEAVEGHAVFTNMVRPVTDDVTVLKFGINNEKIGDYITKGDWRGLPIYTLTIE